MSVRPAEKTESVGQQLERITEGLRRYVRQRRGQDGDAEMMNVAAWRQELVNWCQNTFIKSKYDEAWLSGLCTAVESFSEEELKSFIRSLLS